jgi:ankyrin repeat protein
MNTEEIFFEAIRKGDLNKVEKLLKEDVTLSSAKDERGSTAIILASYYNHIEITKLLLM